ncbi:RHOMBOID-like protein 3, partial [Bienertia sinuspersici]
MGALVMDKIVHKNQGWSLISYIASVPCAGQHVRFISYWKEYKWGENLVSIGLFYAIAGLGGSVISGLFGRSNIFVGASGADFRFYPVASLLMLALIVVVNMGVGILPHVENFAHKGGLLLDGLARNVCHQALIQGGQTTRYVSVPCGSFRLL